MALSWYQKAEEIDPASAWPEYWQALAYIEQNNCQTAVPLLLEAMKQTFNDQTGDAATRYHLANCLYVQGQKDEAKQILEQAVALKAWTGWLELLGDWNLEVGNTVEACALYRRALDVEPENQGARAKLKQCS